jgi:LuxR family maltose regulon positive regulatory protein
MVGVATEGLALVSEGLVDEGMRCLDEATAAALGGEYEELTPVCWTCCNLIYACERGGRKRPSSPARHGSVGPR